MPDSEGPWTALERRQRLSWWALLVGFALFAVVVLLPQELRRTVVPIVLPVAVLISAVSAFRLFLANFWPCPRCGKPFFLTKGIFRSFTRECPHCGLGYVERG